MALPENRPIVNSLLNKLNELILCEKSNDGAWVAFDIIPAGDAHPGLETNWFLWDVRAVNTCRDWDVLQLSDFLSKEQLDYMFDSAFLETETVENMRYKPVFSPLERVKQAREPAACITVHPQHITFTIDWGTEQEAATAVEKLLHSNLDPTHIDYCMSLAELLLILNTLHPAMYYGGPEPRESWENCSWSLEYAQMLQNVAGLPLETYLHEMVTQPDKTQFFTQSTFRFQVA